MYTSNFYILISILMARDKKMFFRTDSTGYRYKRCLFQRRFSDLISGHYLARIDWIFVQSGIAAFRRSGICFVPRAASKDRRHK